MRKLFLYFALFFCVANTSFASLTKVGDGNYHTQKNILTMDLSHLNNLTDADLRQLSRMILRSNQSLQVAQDKLNNNHDLWAANNNGRSYFELNVQGRTTGNIYSIILYAVNNGHITRLFPQSIQFKVQIPIVNLAQFNFTNNGRIGYSLPPAHAQNQQAVATRIMTVAFTLTGIGNGVLTISQIETDIQNGGGILKSFYPDI